MKAALLAFLLTASLASAATEYFVSLNGSDQNAGIDAKTAFRMVQKGVDALAPGDTLTIGPGEYFETVSRENLGSDAATTTIRAAIPGTVRLHGDVPAPSFQPVPGYRFVYAADFDRSAQAVNEIDTLSILEEEHSPSRLELCPGTMYYDEETKKLYISTTDLRPPSEHRYTVSVLQGSGLRLNLPRRVVVEGLAFSGFNNRDRQVGKKTPNVSYIEAVRWGLLLNVATSCAIRDCVASFNGGGLGIDSSAKGGGNEIVKSEAFANYSRFSAEGGNILVSHPNNDVVRDCLAYMGERAGVRAYNQASGPVLVENCVAWGNAGRNISMKGGDMAKFGTASHSVAVGRSSINNKIVASLGLEARRHAGTTDEEMEGAYENCISITEEKNLNQDIEFADPLNLDFRLQADSRFRKAGKGGIDVGPYPYTPNIFYVSANGNDKADGLSSRKAWKTIARAAKNLKAGDTLYLQPGVYDGDVTLRTGRIAGRSTEAVVLTGSIRIEDAAKVDFERTQFRKEVQVKSGRDITFSQCSFAGAPSGLAVQEGNGLRVENCVFTGFSGAGIALKNVAGAFIASNVFDNQQGVGIDLEKKTEAVAFSGYNAYRNGDRAWKIGGEEKSLANEVQSRAQVASFTEKGGALVLSNPLDFVGAGLTGKPQGPFRPPAEQKYFVLPPTVHSVDDTTANLEWYLSHPGDVELEWGTGDEPTQKAVVRTSRFTSYSITGLKPDTEYFFRIRNVQPSDSLEEKGIRVVPSPMPERIAFRTAAQPKAKKTYYVSSSGDDSHDGLSVEAAFKTVGQASAAVGAGDTVLIGDGVYHEGVVVRATGTPDAPITFRAVPGARPVFDGDTRKLSNAFRVEGKHHVVFDGLSFIQFNCEAIEADDLVSSIFQIDQCTNIRISRCFLDGRGKGYSAYFLAARNSNNLTVNNCVMMRCFDTIHLDNCSDTVVEHSVIMRPHIMAVLSTNGPDEKLIFRNNIVTDGNTNKVRARMFNFNYLSSLVDESNCFWMRVPAEERELYTGEIPPNGPKPNQRGSLTIAQFQKAYGKGESLTTDPGFAVLKGMTVEKRNAEALACDSLLDESKVRLDFADLFATNPALAKDRIGLEKEAFKDMPVKRLPLEAATSGKQGDAE